MHLTQKKVSGLQSNGSPQWFNDDETAGLRLFVGAKRGKTWYLSFRDKGRKLSHKLGSADALTVAQARELARDFLSKLAHGEKPHDKTPTPQNITLAQLVDDYEPWVIVERKGGHNTVSAIRSVFAQFLKKRVEDITVVMLEKWRSERISAGLKRATLNRYVTMLKALFSWGVSRDVLETNPIAKLKPLSEHDSDPKIRYLTDDERARLMSALHAREEKMRNGRDSGNIWRKTRGLAPMPVMSGEFADYLRPLVTVALNCGARRGALFSLKWGDVDLENKIILFRAESAKNEKSLRIPMNSVAFSTLVKWKLQSPSRKQDDYVFPSPKTGGRFNNINKSWAALMKAAHIENFRFHDTRHDYASQLVMRGVDIYTVKELLGHSNIQITAKYAHLAPDKLAAAVEMISEPPKNRGVST